jgi:hypothetical protein
MRNVQRSKKSEVKKKNELIQKQMAIIAKLPKIKGTVLRHEGNNALVRMSNGVEKWFTMNTDAERQRFAVGATLEVTKYPMPTDRDSLFERVELFYPFAKYGLSALDWEAEKDGKKYAVFLPGQILSISKDLGVFCSPESSFPGPNNKGKKGFAIVEKEQFFSYEYTLKDIEAAFRHLEEEFTKIQQAKSAAR